MTNSATLLTNQILIGDELIKTGSAGEMEHRYPATGKINGTVHMGGAKEIDAAVARAKEAAIVWEALGPVERRQRIGKLADIVESRAEDFRRLSAAETGMPQQGFIWRLKLSVEWIRTYQAYADKVGGEVTGTTDAGTLEYTRLEPYGVVGIIITWNSPMLSLAMKIPAALAAGNAIVVKPSELTPYTPILFGQCCLEAGIPAGVVNIVPGGPEAGEALVIHPDVEKISFTGGLSTATRMMQQGAPLIKPFCFELGGKSAYTVFEDADIALAATLASKELSNAGQSCKFGSRVFVHDSVYDQYKAALFEAIGKVTIGDPEDMATAMGPLITGSARDRVLSFIDESAGKKYGRLALGGKAPSMQGELGDGYFVQPTVFEDVDPASPLGQEEIFGPVFSLIRFTDEADVIKLVNSTKFGLSNYVHTRDLKRAVRVTAQLKSGTVYVNDANRRNPGAPFGGFRGSGIGYEGGRPGLEEYLRKKTVGLA
jgi:aldehyde dehydrogenase (NAD+)